MREKKQAAEELKDQVCRLNLALSNKVFNKLVWHLTDMYEYCVSFKPLTKIDLLTSKVSP